MLYRNCSRSNGVSFPPKKGKNTILLQEQKVGNYVESPQTQPEGGWLSLLTRLRREFKSGQSKGFLLSA